MTRRYALCCLSIVPLLSPQSCVIHIHDGGRSSGEDWARDRSVRGSGRVSERSIRSAGITGVHLATLGELEIQLGDTEELRIEADDNLLEHFEIEKRGDTLRIGTRDGTWLRHLGQFVTHLRSRSSSSSSSRAAATPMPEVCWWTVWRSASRVPVI